MKHDVDNLLGLERPTDPGRVEASHRETAQDADHLGQGKPEAIGVGLEDGTHEALTVLEDFWVDEVSRMPETLLVGLEGHHDPVDPAEHALEDPHDRDQPLFHRQRPVDGGESVEMVSSGKSASAAGEDEFILAVEHAKEGALGDTGCLGELSGRRCEALVEHDRLDGREDRCPAFVGGQGSGAGRHTENCK